MQLPYDEELNIEYLARLFDNTSECYKFFWFKAIIDKVVQGNQSLTYGELVDSMIADAWYMVNEYRLNLGPKDTLEILVKLIKRNYPDLKSCEKKSVLVDFIKSIDDKEIVSKKKILTYNVPYRLQAPFMKEVNGNAWKVGQGNLIEKINQEKYLMYYFGPLQGLETKIIFQDSWMKYIIKNQEIIRGWLEYKMILYLQRRNPSVPGIADKIYPPQERKLDKVKKYWKMILTVEPVVEIYGDNPLTGDDISIDHFVPWSYVAHDEMWNLNPTTKSINSAKSNKLPDWDRYFSKLVKQEYQSYCLLWRYTQVHKEFDRCAKEHINSEEVRYRIYREGLSKSEFADELKRVLSPVYQAAQNCGFSIWKYEVEKNESI